MADNPQFALTETGYVLSDNDPAVHGGYATIAEAADMLDHALAAAPPKTAGRVVFRYDGADSTDWRVTEFETVAEFRRRVWRQI